MVLVSGLTKLISAVSKPELQGRELPDGQLPTRSMYTGLHRPKGVLAEEEKNFFSSDEGKNYCQYPPICGFVHKYKVQ